MTEKPAWTAAALQLALFTQSPIPRTIDPYATLTGGEPDTREDRLKDGTIRQTGIIGSKQLQVGFGPPRLDVVLSPIPASLLEQGAIPEITMGPFHEELAEFTEMVRPLLASFEVPIVRMSLVCAALAETPDRTATYNLLADHIKSVRVTPEMEEMMFRINWKAKTDLLSEGYLNRISTWSSIKFTAASGVDPSRLMTTSARSFARLDLDINTPAGRTEALPSEKLIAIFDELTKLTIENVENGECR